jgi:Ca-activated chloride channel homolog
MRPARGVLAAVALAAVSVAWLDPHTKAREAGRLYTAGKYDDAVARYNEALTDEPDSPLLHFNLGDAAYKQGKYTDALNAFQQVPTGDADPVRTARVAYNMGNAKYRLGEAAEASDAKAALGLYAEALVAYRRAMGAAPDDVDAKFNHEFVEKKIADLKKKLEEQQKQQEQKQRDQQEQQQQQDQQQQGQQQQDQQKSEEEQQQQQAQDQGEKKEEEKKPDEQDRQAQQNAAQPAGNGERKEGQMSQQEAAALLDSQRDQEVQPDEVAKRLQGAVVAEPAQDW